MGSDNSSLSPQMPSNNLRIIWSNTISNESDWKSTNQDTIIKWKWIGSTLRNPYDDITWTSLDWNLQGRRRKASNTWIWNQNYVQEYIKLKSVWWYDDITTVSHELRLTGAFKEGEGERQTHGHEIKTMFKNTWNWNKFVKALSSSYKQ